MICTFGLYIFVARYLIIVHIHQVICILLKATIRQNHPLVQMFASQARYLKFRLRDGMKVFITAQVSVFERAGRYQLYVRSMQEDGLGKSLHFASMS